jgi:hypothetical protein
MTGLSNTTSSANRGPENALWLIRQNLPRDAMPAGDGCEGHTDIRAEFSRDLVLTKDALYIQTTLNSKQIQGMPNSASQDSPETSYWRV